MTEETEVNKGGFSSEGRDSSDQITVTPHNGTENTNEIPSKEVES